MTEIAAPAIVALVAMGMAVAFVRADPAAPTSRALALTLAATGLSILSNVSLRVLSADGFVPLWARPAVLIDCVAFIAGYDWIRRIRKTIPAGELKTRFGDAILRVAQALALVYGVLGIVFPTERVQNFLGGLFADGAITSTEFMMFAAPLEIGLLLAAISILLVLNRKPDAAERVRLVAFMVAAPFIASGLVLPFPVAPFATVTGLLVFLVGAVKFHVLQGRRGLFLSRFLSPQVARLVRRRGLESAIVDSRIELSIVCCDLRGFTRFAGANDSSAVIALLREFYDVVGDAVGEFEGTVKDYAGDGVLVLIGAPIERDDHAVRAVALAESIVRRWQARGRPLAIGIGVASGVVTVGIVGGEGRLEYAAVGPAVNLASRLCDEAGPGEILVAGDTISRLPGAAADKLDSVTGRGARILPGFEQPVAAVSLKPA